MTDDKTTLYNIYTASLSTCTPVTFVELEIFLPAHCTLVVQIRAKYS